MVFSGGVYDVFEDGLVRRGGSGVWCVGVVGEVWQEIYQGGVGVWVGLGVVGGVGG